MNNKLLIGIVVVVLGLGAGWYFLRGNQGYGSPTGGPTTAPASSPSAVTGGSGATGSAQPTATATVSYTDNGFSPASITVKVGTTVTFVNQSGSSMWVASAVHPTHQLLPGFDELTSVSRGGSYQYTFVKVGTWKYHNHMSPSDTGVVIATP